MLSHTLLPRKLKFAAQALVRQNILVGFVFSEFLGVLCVRVPDMLDDSSSCHDHFTEGAFDAVGGAWLGFRLISCEAGVFARCKNDYFV